MTKLNPAGSALVFSTYLGGSGGESASGIAVDSSGSVYVTGLTTSPDFPTMNPFQAANTGDAFDAFVTKLNPAGRALLFSTYLGGSALDLSQGISIDSSRNIYVIGTTTSSDFPTKNPLQAANAGGFDAFVANLPRVLVRLSSAALTFGYHEIGSASLIQTVTLTNAGFDTLSISSVTASAGFSETNSCGTSLTAGGNCAIQVTFTPTALSVLTGMITITDDAAGSPHVVSLSGIGAAKPTLVFPGTVPVPDPPRITNIDFGSEPVSTPSTPHPVTVANASNQPLLVRRVLSSRQFAHAGNCGGSIAPGTSCSIVVTFMPTFRGPRRGVLIVVDTGRPRVALVRLAGTGI